MKMSGGRVSVLFRDWVGCKFLLLKFSCACHCLDMSTRRCKCCSFFCARLEYFLHSVDCSWIISSDPSSA